MPDYTGTIPDAPPRRAAATLAVIWCGVTLLLAYGAASIPGGAPSPWSASDTAQAPPLARFDAGWYRTIALQGYADPAAARFYPLQPLVAGALSRFARIPFFEAATGLSLACVVFAAMAFASMLPRGTAGAAAAPLAALLFYPTSFFLAAPTSDALFLLSVAATLGAARQGRWTLAGIAGAAAALTRAHGFLLALALAAAAAPDGSGSRSRGRWIAAGAVLAAGALFPLFIGRRFGDPTLAWRSPEGSAAPLWRLPLEIFREATHRLREPGAGGKLVFAMAIGSLLLFAVLAAVAWRRGDRPGALFSLAALLFLLARGSLHGMHREVLSLLPCYPALANGVFRRAPLAFTYVFAGVGIGVLLLVRFVLWIPIE